MFSCFFDTLIVRCFVLVCSCCLRCLRLPRVYKAHAYRHRLMYVFAAAGGFWLLRTVLPYALHTVGYGTLSPRNLLRFAISLPLRGCGWACRRLFQSLLRTLFLPRFIACLAEAQCFLLIVNDSHRLQVMNTAVYSSVYDILVDAWKLVHAWKQ